MTDLEKTWKTPGMAAQQRAIVDGQLAEMRAGHPPFHFAAVGEWARDLTRDRPLTLLDVGCSSGYYREIVEHYAPGRVTYTGCDYAPDFVDLARERNPGVPFDIADAQMLPYADRAFDVVLTGATLCLVVDWKRALSEVARVARRFLILHRTWVHDGDTYLAEDDAYGQPCWQWHWNFADIAAELPGWGLREARQVESGQPCGCFPMSYLLERR